MSVLIVELGGSHMENVYTIVHLFYLKKQPVYFIANEGLNNLIKEKEKISGIYLVPDKLNTANEQLNVLRKIKSVVKEKNINTIIFGTTEIKPVRNILLLLPNVNLVGILHDALKLDSSPTFKYIYSLRLHKYMVFGNFIRSNLKKHPKKNLYPFFPVYFPKPAHNPLVKNPEEIWIAVPGVVKSERKDYIPLLKKILEAKLPENIKLIFLGKADRDESEIKSLIEKINSIKQKVVTFDDYLEYDIFHHYLAKTDFILPLLKINDDFFYGNSRISGAFNLAYSYQLPLLLPASYKKNTDLIDYSLYYNTTNELYELLQLISERKVESRQIRKAYEVKDQFNFDKMADGLTSFIHQP